MVSSVSPQDLRNFFTLSLRFPQAFASLHVSAEPLRSSQLCSKSVASAYRVELMQTKFVLENFNNKKDSSRIELNNYWALYNGARGILLKYKLRRLRTHQFLVKSLLVWAL